MKKFITAETVSEFESYLNSEEKSSATVEKYIRDVGVFVKFINGKELTKDTVIDYKKYLRENYAARSVNSMLAGVNALFSFLGRFEFRVKPLKIQQQTFCPEEKELTKAEYFRLCREAQQKNNERLNLILQTICGTGIK